MRTGTERTKGRALRGGKTPADPRRRGSALLAVAGLLFALFIAAPGVAAQDDLLQIVQKKQAELKEREDGVRREEERIAALRKDVDARIKQYTDLLARIEAALGRVEQAQEEKLANVVKAYETMPPEDAAARLSALDHETALLIMLRMKSKKAGAIMASMEPRKAADLTRSMANVLQPESN